MLKQEELILSVKERVLEDERVDSIMMYGSFTQGSGDEFSDVEFYIFVDDSCYEGLNTEEWISSIHPVYTHFYNEFGTEVVIFTNLVRGEFHFLPSNKTEMIESFGYVGYFPDVESMCLCDKQGRLRESLRVLEECAVDRQTAENAESVINNLLNSILYGTNVFKRGEHARSLECLYYSQKYYLQLVRLVEDRTDYWVNPFKNLEQDVSVSAYGGFRRCTSDLEPLRILGSYKSLLEESKKGICVLQSRHSIRDFGQLINKLEEYIQS